MIIRTKFLLVFLAIAILPLITICVFIFGAARTAITSQTTSNMQTIATLKTSHLKAVIDTEVALVSRTANRASLVNLVASFNQSGAKPIQDQIVNSLKTTQDNFGEVRAIVIVNTTGRIIGSTDPKLIGTTDTYATTPIEFVQPKNTLPMVRISQPLQQNGIRIGTVTFTIEGEQLDAITQDYTGLGKTGDVVFVKLGPGSEPIVSASRFTNRDPAQTTLISQLSSQPIARALAAHKDSSGTIDTTATPFFFTLHYLSAYGISLITKIDSSEAFEGVTQLLDSVLVFALILVPLVIMLILFFVHSITGPIANLASVAEKTMEGNLEERALVLSNDEIGNLASSFNHMLDELQKSKNNLEQKVHERTRQLEESNKELESFSYSVSHDLRAPLRAIDGFSKILLEDYSGKLGPDGQHVLSTIVKSTQQMGNLIDDLLTFSRLGRQDIKTQSVDMGALVQEVFDEQKRYNPKRIIEFTLHRLPAANVDYSLMRQVWVNLLSNAVKYTKYKDVAAIEVGAHTQDHDVIYYVKDNGAGFDMAYVDKLFGVFQRLHEEKDFEGTGVGLAIIKRIVTRHRGKVWAESRVDKGAVFSFSLPRAHKR